MIPDLQSHPHTLQEATDLLQDQQGMWGLHSSQIRRNLSWAQAVSCSSCLCVCSPASSGSEGCSAFP